MIPLLDLHAQYRSVQVPLEAAVIDVLRSGEYVLGRPVAQFEEAFAAYCSACDSVALSSGTAALHLALTAAGVGPGDEVITVPMTFVATVAAIVYAGATPVLVDVDAATYTINPDAFEAAITSRTRAVIPVHLHGRLADMERICAIANRHGLVVIEDAAQAHGAERGGRRAGTFGTVGCFSFYPGKNLGACGEGGALVSNDGDITSAVRCLRDWGQEGKYNHIRHGYNYRMDTLQAAVLGVKLPHLPAWTDGRRRVAAQYDRLLSQAGLLIPEPAGLDHVYHVYAVRVRNRDAVRAELAKAGIATGIHYPRPVHLQPAYQNLVADHAGFPVAEQLADELLSLPIYPELTDQQVRRVSEVLINAVDTLGSCAA